MLRDKSRYGLFSAVSPEIGKCQLEITISGWTEKLVVHQRGKAIASDEFPLECDDEFDSELDGTADETDEFFFVGNCYHLSPKNGYIRIFKPLGKCLKRYK